MSRSTSLEDVLWSRFMREQKKNFYRLNMLSKTTEIFNVLLICRGNKSSVEWNSLGHSIILSHLRFGLAPVDHREF